MRSDRCRERVELSRRVGLELSRRANPLGNDVQNLTNGGLRLPQEADGLYQFDPPRFFGMHCGYVPGRGPKTLTSEHDEPLRTQKLSLIGRTMAGANN